MPYITLATITSTTKKYLLKKKYKKLKNTQPKHAHNNFIHNYTKWKSTKYNCLFSSISIDIFKAYNVEIFCINGSYINSSCGTGDAASPGLLDERLNKVSPSFTHDLQQTDH